MLARQHATTENPAFFRDIALLHKSDRLLREVGDNLDSPWILISIYF